MSSSLFESVTPRDDVLSGVLSDSVFAASLDEVVAGSAPDAYQDAVRFFDASYPSGGLRSLLNEVLGRVGGAQPDGAPVVRLETNLGGGKTHNLIALYHAARGQLDPMKALEFMDPERLPVEPIDQVAVFVGTASGATSFPTVDGVTPKTIWGYLALQIGGAAAYERLRGDDEDLTAPGAATLREVMGDKPTLILIDEIARYLAVGRGKPVGGSTLADQTTAFLMALMEAVAGVSNAALVITTTQVTDAFGDETAKVLEAVAEAQSLMARKEHVLHPSDEADLPKILSRRLFASVDSGAAATVAARYAEAARDAFDRGTDLPDRLTTASWGSDIENAYPFHPDLITVLDKRLSTIPNFQRTRGALRLLARSVRLLWENQPAGTELIHLHHIDLSDKELANELSSRLDRSTFEPVIRADIASQPGGEASHAEAVDAHMGAPFARRLASAIYLYSLTKEVPGVPSATLTGSVLAPGDDPNVIAKALDNLEAAAWYLHTDVQGFRFSVEPSLAKLIQEAESQIAPGKVKQAATDILAHLFRDSALKVRRTWEDAKIPDRDDDAWLVILHWDEFSGVNGVIDTSVVPDQITELWEKTPTGGLRDFRNRLVFLAPSAPAHEAMLTTVRRHLALKELAGSSTTMSALTDDKRAELRGKAEQSELEARVAVCNHVNLLYVPEKSGLECIELDVVTQASLKKNQSDAVMDRLAAMEKTLAAGDKPLDPGFVRTKLGKQFESSMSTIELVRVFARRSDLKLVLDRAQISALVTAGVRNGVWEYHDASLGDKGWATAAKPGVSVHLGDDTYICPPGSAPADTAATPTKPGGVILPPIKKPETAPGAYNATGKAGVAVESARQNAVDGGVAAITTFTIAIEAVGVGTGTELAKLLTVVPASTPDAEVRYVIDVQAVLGDHNDRLDITFAGSPGQYQPLKSPVTEVLKHHEAVVKASVVARFDPPLDLSGDAFADLKQRADDTGPARATIELGTDPA